MTEHAIAIARVSAGKQREEDQTPGLVAYAERKGYILDDVVSVHGRSAFHGKHVKYILAAVEKHVRNGLATVVIFRHVDRSSREGVFEGFDLLRQIMQAGARVEFSEQEYLTEQPGMIGLFFDMAKKESEIKRDRKLQGNTVKRGKGEMIGRAPWGYEYILRDDIRVGIKPSELGRNWIPAIFQAAIDGKSLRAICNMLEGIPSPQKNGGTVWHESVVRRLITCKTYYGAMRGNPNLKFDPLVSVAQYKAANTAVESRKSGGRTTVKHPAALVRAYCGVCWEQERDGCPSGKSPLYRWHSGTRYASYCCKGHGPKRNGCGAPGILVVKLDAAVDAIMLNDDRPYMTTEYHAGDDVDEQRAIINERIKAAQEAGDYLLVSQLAQEMMAIGPSVRSAHVEQRPSGLTVGQRWASLSIDGKRDELTRWTVIAWPDKVHIFGPWHDDPKQTIISDIIETEENL
jgi:DNA invertase Pin-like site-specific DNA recombinase